MNRADKPKVEPLAHTWLTVGLRLAVIAGASTAFVSLLCHRSVSTACLRGAIAFAAAWIVVRTAHIALSRAATKSEGNHRA